MKLACVPQCVFGTKIVTTVLSPLLNVPLEGLKLTPVMPLLDTDQLSGLWEPTARVSVTVHTQPFLRVQSLCAFKELGLTINDDGIIGVCVGFGAGEWVGVGIGCALWFTPATGDGLGVVKGVDGYADGMGEIFEV